MSYLNKEEVKELEDKLKACELVVSDDFEYVIKNDCVMEIYDMLNIKDSFGVRLDDEYLANTNIRANNFLVEFCEHNDMEEEFIVVTGNHKGSRRITILKVEEG